MQAAHNCSENEHKASWDCLYALENALAETSTLIEIHKKNYQAISAQYKEIILSACEEIKHVYQRVCGEMLEAKANISTYIKSVTSHHEDFFNSEITMPEHNEVLKPWSACAAGNDPAFWTAYNKIKQTDVMENATLECAIYSMAALFALLLVWH